jgi:hypothetical protein
MLGLRGANRLVNPSQSHSDWVFKIFTGKPPFYGFLDTQVIHKVVVKRERPEIPASASLELKQLYPTLKLCWASEPSRRPSVNEIVIQGSDSSLHRPRRSSWSLTKLTRIVKRSSTDEADAKLRGSPVYEQASY